MTDAIQVVVQWQKNTYNIDISPNATVLELKTKIEALTTLHPATQKLMKGAVLKDHETLAEKGIKNGNKVMLIATSVADIVNVVTSATEVSKSPFEEVEKKVPLSKQEVHSKIIAKGVPEDAVPGEKGKKYALPQSIPGILTKTSKVRLTFHSDKEEVWVASATSTQKLPYGAIKKITSEAIEGQEQYHLMGFQVGANESSTLWLYFVPAQYVESIKDAILGMWSYFS